MKFLLVNDSEESIDEVMLSMWLDGISKELLSRKVLKQEDNELEVSLVFLKETDAKLLNWNYRQKDYATDVLSFETDDPASLGELVFCLPILRKQAQEHRQSFEHEMGYMILHGVLHLLGYDHEKDEEEAEAMFEIQDEVFQVLTKSRVKPKKPSKKAAGSTQKAKQGKATPKKPVSKKASAKKTKTQKSPKKQISKKKS